MAFYSHDTYGLGHLRRSLHLAAALEGSGTPLEMLLVTGSPRAHFFQLPRNLQVVRIPAVTKNAEGRYVSRNGEAPLAETLRQRKRKIREEIIRFKPDLLLVDHAPNGLRGELLPLLADLRAHTNTELVLGLRDILDEPERVKGVWTREGTYDLLRSIYHHVWVYGCRSVFPVDRLYEVPGRVATRIRFLGYLNRGRPALRESTPRISESFPHSDRPHLLCLVGGGGDGYPLARSFLRMLAASPERWNGTLITGPFLSRDKRDRLAGAHDHLDNVQMLRFTSNVESLIQGSDALITMGGYNALMEAVACRKKTVVVPRVFPRREQWLRATAFEKLGLVRTVDPEALSPETLARTSWDLLEGPAPPAAADLGIPFDGTKNFVRHVLGLLEARHAVGKVLQHGRERRIRA